MPQTSLRDLRLPALAATGVEKERAARVLNEVKYILESPDGNDSCQALPRSSCSLAPGSLCAFSSLLKLTHVFAMLPEACIQACGLLFKSSRFC